MRTILKYSTLGIFVLYLLILPASAIFVWADTAVDSNDMVGEYTSLAFNPGTNTPAISYYDATNNALKYAWYDGAGWANTTIDNTAYGIGRYTSLAFNPGTNTPAISYQDWSPNFNLKYAWYDGSVWQTAVVDNDGSVGYYTSLAFNITSGYPAISYYDGSNTALKYAWYDGAVWQKTIIDNAGSVGTYTSLAFNPVTNTPAISYCDFENSSLKYAWYDGAVWQKTVVDNDGWVGQYTSLAFNPGTNTPAISYYDLGIAVLRYAWYDGSVWQKTMVDNEGNVGEYTSLAFNASTNTPAISYFDAGVAAGTENLKYAWYDGSGWVKESVDNTAVVGYYSSLAFNATTSKPAISYWDWTNQNLKYTAYVPAGDINISSSPDGAWIWLDGVNTTERTNMTLTAMAPGTYDVTVQKPGYVTPAYETVAVVSNATTAVSFNLIGQTGILQVNSTPSGASVYLNGNATGALTNVTFTDRPVGVYNVTVEKEGYEPATRIALVTNGTTESVDFTLTLLPPVANFTVDPAAGTAPLTVQFNDTSSGTVDTWLWDFGDGVTSTDQNPSHTFTVGSYTVALTAGNTTAGNDTFVKNNCITARMPISDGDGDNLPAGTKKETGNLLTSSDGKVLQKTVITSDDGIATLTLPPGTSALDGDGEPLTNITIQTVSASAVPPIPDGAAFRFAGFTYECSPAGATFAPPITLTFTLTAEEWEALTPEGDFSVRLYNKETEMWEELLVAVDPATHTVTASVSHFSPFALCLEAADTTIPETKPMPGATISTAPAETNSGDATGTPVPSETQKSPIGLAPVAAFGALALLRRRR